MKVRRHRVVFHLEILFRAFAQHKFQMDLVRTRRQFGDA